MVARHPKPAGCHGCSLNGEMAQSAGYAPADGNPNSAILFVGEALGEREVYSGVPFSGDAGGMFSAMLRRSGLDRLQVRVDNVVRCQPPGNWLEGAPWQYPAINHCSQYLSQTIAESNRAHRVIVTLGGVALRQVLGLSGDGISVKDFHGTVHQLSTGQFVVPTFHPSYLQRGAINMFDVVRFDIDRARDVARGGWSPRPVAIVCDPSVAWFDAWATRALAAGAADPLGCWLAVDCETPDKAGGRDEGELTPEDQSTTILRVNFSAHPDEGITVPYIGPYITIIERLLASSLIKVLWNKNYDRRRFVINRHTIGGEWWDIMWAWHRLQSDLPRGLGFAAPFASDYGAWKHLSRIPGQEAKYAAIDGFQTLRLAHYITRHLIEQGMWDVFQRHTHDLEEIVLRPAYELGVNVDLPALDAFHEHLDKVCGEKLDLIKHQEAAGTLKPKNGYAKKPKGARCGACNGTGRAFTEPSETGEVFDSGIPCGVCEGAASLAPSPPAGILGKKKGKEHTAKDDYIVGGIKLISKETAVSVLDCVTCGSQGVSAKHRCGVPNRQVQRRISAQGEARNSTDGHEARQALSDGQLDTTPTQSALVAAEALVSRATTEPRYFWHLPFNPDSSQQLLKYITDTGHSPGRAKKTRKPTSNAETLRKLAKSTGDPIYSLILDYRAVKKVDSTYALGVKKRIWADGRIHPEYTFKPSTGRLSYQNPNITNVIQDKGGKQSLAAGFRRVITAAPDCRLLEVDYSGIEAVETGWYLNDPAVIRLAKLGIHAYLTSHLINKPASLSWSDSDLAMYFKELKAAHPQDYDKAKRCVHGNNYGLTIYGMVENFPDVFHSLKEAQTTQDLYYSIVPGLPAFHEQVRLRAKRQGYLGGADHPFHYKHFFFGVESLRSANQREYLKLKGRHSRDLVILDGRPFKRALGEDSKRVIAFYPQSTSAGVLIEAMLMLFTPDSFYYIGDAYYGRTPLRAPIHDSLLLEIPVAQWDRVVANVVSVMQAQIPEQPCPAEWQMGDYLRIGVAAKASAVAGNWMDMKEFDISGIGLPAVPETARELMYTPIEDDEREDFADLGTIITDAAARAMAQTSTNAATGATGAPIVTIN